MSTYVRDQSTGVVVLEDEPHDECGVFGVFAPGEEVSKITYYGLYALQHRGQEAAGIACGDGERVVVFKDLGLVSQVFDEQTLAALQGDLAIGHTRYSTAGGVRWENSQPIFRTSPNGTDVALAHNGNLTNHHALMDEARELKLIRGDIYPSDSEVMCAHLANGVSGDKTVLDAARELLPRLQGAFSIVFTDGKNVYAARDRHGVRPLSIGRLERGWVVASETCALDIIGASFVRTVEPGELITINASGISTERFADKDDKFCVFEYVYLARPDSDLRGKSVNEARAEIGRRLAEEAPAEADLVIPVPSSGIPAAVGYAQGSGMPYGSGLVKNNYVGRTFIQPTQNLRQLGIRLKLNPLRDEIKGKRLVVVDDSIVRGNTQRALVRMLREAGATEVHVRIASPPVKWPCFYGIDFATPGELIANAVDAHNYEGMVEAVRSAINADSLGYVSIRAMVEATEQPYDSLCRACFDGIYPLGLPAGNANADLVKAMQRTDALDTQTQLF
ncbi:MAG: amidophosphoribosyltransferase [Corynebacterium sp.]|nr:amidophosphoribosyltransferase [Corynebacterium sp.]